MNKIKSFFIVLLLLVPCIAIAQTCDKPQSSESARVYFVNGMNNTFLGSGSKESEAFTSKIKLQELLGLEVSAVGNSFNFKENFYPQLKQVALQRLAQPVEFWQWMSHLSNNTLGPTNAVPQWMKDAAINAQITKAMELNSKLYFTDKDLQTMVAQYLLDLQSGKKIVLVAHSQGNFYANNAYIYIRNNYPQYSNSIGIVMVASPASFNASGGPHTNNDKDLILQTVKLLYPILSYTGSFNQPNDVLDHNFNTVYLADWGNGKGKFEIKESLIKST